MTVESTIEAADLTDFDVYSGDCVNIAAALNDVYGGQYVAAYATSLEFEQGKPAHFAIRIEGTLYDGGGTTSEGALRDRAYYGVSDQHWDDIVVTEVPHPDPLLYDEDRVQTLVERFETARSEP